MVEVRSLRERVRAQGLEWDSPESLGSTEKAEVRQAKSDARRSTFRSAAELTLPASLSSHSELA